MSSDARFGFFRHGELLAVACALLLCRSPLSAAEPSQVEILVDLREASTGFMWIDMRWTGLDNEDLKFKRLGKSGEHEYTDLSFQDGSGVEIEFEESGDVFELATFKGRDVRLRYKAWPGGIGRHGHQGHISEQFAVFDGRVFLVPVSTRILGSAKLRFQRPQGWSVATPWPKKGDAYTVDGGESQQSLLRLSESCVGVGPFETQVRRIGESELRVHSYSSWSEEHREYLLEHSTALLQYFQDVLGFEPDAPYSLVWTPKSKGERVFGGSAGNGTCFEFPEPSRRNWELVAHRLGHAINKYGPTGIDVRHDRDHWFMEGWASYIEVAATLATGAAEDHGRLSDLYREYLVTLALHPEQDMPLAREREARGEAIEFLHYVKGPLVVKMLDSFVRDRSGKNLEQFMGTVYRKHRESGGQLFLRAELEEFVGAPLDDFWHAFVDKTGAVVPVWEEILEPARGESELPPALTIGSVPIHGDYLFHLASSGKFERYSEILTFLQREIRNRKVLNQAGIHILPPHMREHRDRLPPRARADLAEIEADWFWLDDLARRSDAPASGPMDVQFQPDSEDGRVFASLLLREHEFDQTIGRSGARYVEAMAGIGEASAVRRTSPTLGVLKGETVVFQVHWAEFFPKVQLTIGLGGKILRESELVIQPGWLNTWSSITMDDPEFPSGIFTYTVSQEGTQIVERSYWYRRR